jgi:hypothetical protein
MIVRMTRRSSIPQRGAWTCRGRADHRAAMAMLVFRGHQVELPDAGECVIGRQRDCGLAIDDGAASRRHARVFRAEGRWWVEDLGSANGTLRNGEPLTARHALRNGDVIRIGEAEVLFGCDERESPAADGPVASASRVDPQSLEGRTVAGYRIDALMGRSALGFLYRAQQASLQRAVAFKIFARRVVQGDAGFADRFRELVARAGALRHDGFVQLHENGIEDGLPWYAMELIQGDSLLHLLERERRLAPELALLVMERAALAMAAAHDAGIVHGDLAPRTIMLTGEGAVKIVDLGIAAELGRARDVGKPEGAWYAAPELSSNATAEPSADVYALGCVLHHLLTGAPPFTGPTAEAVRRGHLGSEIPRLRPAVPALPASIDELLPRLLNKNPEWRISDMR